MAGGTSYISTGMLTSQPAGLSWNVVPTLTASGAGQLAQLATVCGTATSQADTYCRQPLRATVSTETLRGPGMPRVSVERDTGIAGLITRRWPVTQVLAVQVSPARTFPPEWVLVEDGQYSVRHPPVLSAGPAMETGPSGGNAVGVAPGWITPERGKWNILLSYVAAYPHCGIASAASEGGTTLQVDDVTAWDGVTGIIYDGASTEFAQVLSATAAAPVQLPGVAGTAQAGTGTLTLSSPLAFDHDPGTVLSAIPLSAVHGVALMAAVQALETIDAIATQSLSGQMAGGTGVLAEQAEIWLSGFRRWS
jgi:hypothetical protein